MHAQNDRHIPKCLLREFPCFLSGTISKIPAEYRNEGRRRTNLRRHAADKIGQPVGKDERIGGRRCPEEKSYPLIA